VETAILRKQQQLSCRAFTVIALLVMAFGPHDPQTLRHLTSFCVDFLKKESTVTTQEAWITINLTLKQGKLQKKKTKNSERVACLSSRRRWTFSATAVILHCLSQVALKK
jgi:hypothetical protein